MDWSPLFLSFRVALLSTTVTALLGVGIGALLANARFVGRNLVDVLVTAPLVFPPTVLGYYLLVALGRRSFLGTVFTELTGSSIVFTQTGAVVAGVVGGLPLAVKAARAAFESVDPSLVHAARTLGAGTLRILFTIQIPLAHGGIIAGIMLAFARSLGDFGVTLMIAGNIPGETQTASLAIYDAIQANRDSDALGMVLVLTAIALTMLYAVVHLTSKPARA